MDWSKLSNNTQREETDMLLTKAEYEGLEKTLVSTTRPLVCCLALCGHKTKDFSDSQVEEIRAELAEQTGLEACAGCGGWSYDVADDPGSYCVDCTDQ